MSQEVIEYSLSVFLTRDFKDLGGELVIIDLMFKDGTSSKTYTQTLFLGNTGSIAQTRQEKN